MLLVAVSGGIDSMCLAEKVRQSGEPFAIAHCNFGLRGADSNADEALVRSWAAGHGITCHVRSFETSAYAAENGISIEMAARRLRYHWFGELCREHGYSGVAVAHNANDNAETLILNLLRGTGIRGIIGMKAEGFIPDPDFSDIPLLRPLLGMTREEIEAFAKENGVKWREDATNAQNDYKRNKIRNLVFPVFAQINPSFIQTLNRDMERIASEGICKAEDGDMCRGDSVSLRSTPAPPTAKCTGPGASSLSAPSVSGPLPLPMCGGAHAPRHMSPSSAPEYSISEETWDGTQPVKQQAGVLIMDAEKAGEFFEGRWETGDWIKPLGAPGKKKMQDWFTDHHISADEKPFVPLLKSKKDPHHVLAVIPYCIDNSVKVTSHTKRIIRISSAGQQTAIYQ